MEDQVSYSIFKPYLNDGETILWRGQPAQGHLLSRTDIFMIPFSLLWAGFAFFWEFSVLQMGVTPFALFGIPFVLMGLYMVVGRFFHMAWLRKRTYYAITDLKVIRIRNRKADMLMKSSLPPVSLETYADGYGTIRIGHAVMYRRRNTVVYGADRDTFTLENIPDVIRVQQLLTRT